MLTAENGLKALDVLERRSVDLVLSDLVMPGMDGLELCKRVKAIPALDMVPFLLLTALHDRATLIRGLNLGADDFLVKPFNEGELLARVRGQLRIRELAKKLAESNRLAVTGTLLSGMAHALRNPVNVLVNGIAPLREHPGSPAQGPRRRSPARCPGRRRPPRARARQRVVGVPAQSRRNWPARGRPGPHRSIPGHS